MNFLDMKTIFFMASLMYVICTFFIYVVYRQGKNRFNGLFLIFSNFILQTLGTLLIFLRGIIPDFLSIIVANLLIVSGIFLSLIGYEKFLDKKGKHYHNFLLLILFFIMIIYFTYFNPSLKYRILNFSVFVFLLSFQIFYLFIFKTSREERKTTFYLGLVYLAYCFLSFIRIIGVFVFKDNNIDFLSSGMYESLARIFYQMLFIILTFTIILVLNKKISYKLEKEEEKFSKSFHNFPYALLLTNFDDGRIFEVNKGFEKITGFSADEVIGKTTIDIKIWETRDDRELFIKNLEKSQEVCNYEMKFSRKNGDKVTGLLSSSIINIDNKKILITSINDISERKEAEEKIKSLLNEKELLLKEVHHRIKNNMNVVYSLLSLQAYKITEENTKNIILDAANRVKSMMFLYDKLYRQNIKEPLSIKEYFPNLIKEILLVFPDAENIKTDFEIEDLKLDQNKLSKIGIIINELVTNSLKYAFKGINNPKISLQIFSKDNSIIIDYKDNGIGIKETNKNKNEEGFGMELLKILVAELKGKMSIKEDGGANFIFSFPQSVD